MNNWYIFLTRYWLPISIGVSIGVLCLIPAAEINKVHVKIKHVDLMVHFFMFFSFAASLFFDLNKSGAVQNKTNSPLLISLLICALFGITTESLQSLLIFLNRSGSYVDLLFDFVGSLTGIGCMKIIKRKSVSGF
jgi:VanZ family protein